MVTNNIIKVDQAVFEIANFFKIINKTMNLLLLNFFTHIWVSVWHLYTKMNIEKILLKFLKTFSPITRIIWSFK